MKRSGVRSRAAWRRALGALAVIVLLAPAVARAGDEPDLPPDIELYSQRGCPHCDEARAFLDALVEERPELIVVEHRVSEDAAGRERFRRITETAGVNAATPSLFIRGHLIVGWDGDDRTGRVIEAILDGEDIPPGEAGAVCKVDFDRPDAEPECADPRDRVVDLPIFGEVKARDLGLPTFTIVLGLVDGFNPCAMWVLLFLLSLLVHLKSRARMFAIAGTFVLVSGAVYFAFMAAWFTIFDYLGQLRLIQVVLGAMAIFVGAVHVKDTFAFKKGLSFSIPESAKPGIYSRVNRILTAENMAGALVTVIVLAVMVNTVELLCTAGLPAIYTNVLASHELSRWQNYGYIALYQVFYMADDALMLVIAIVTLSRKRLQEKAGRWLKLLSGAVMIGLGLTLVFKPAWLYW